MLTNVVALNIRRYPSINSVPILHLTQDMFFSIVKKRKYEENKYVRLFPFLFRQLHLLKSEQKEGIWIREILEENFCRKEIS